MLVAKIKGWFTPKTTGKDDLDISDQLKELDETLEKNHQRNVAKSAEIVGNMAKLDQLHEIVLRGTNKPAEHTDSP